MISALKLGQPGPEAHLMFIPHFMVQARRLCSNFAAHLTRDVS